MKKMSKVVSLMLVLAFMLSAISVPSIEVQAASDETEEVTEEKIPADQVVCVDTDVSRKKKWTVWYGSDGAYCKYLDSYIKGYSDGSIWRIDKWYTYRCKSITYDEDDWPVLHGKKLVKKTRKVKCRRKGNSDFKP